MNVFICFIFIIFIFTILTQAWEGTLGDGVDFSWGRWLCCIILIPHSVPHAWPQNLLSGALVTLVSSYCYLFNSGSNCNKAHFIHYLIVDWRCDLVCMTKIWLGIEAGIPHSEMCPPGYWVWHQVWLQGRGGGMVFDIWWPPESCPRHSPKVIVGGR